MNTVYFYDENFNKSDTYKNYISNNPQNGFLSIRAYAANAAIPISGLEIKVSKVIDNYKVIFYEGKTDNSGLISNISLPAPIVNPNTEEIPLSQDYDILAIYEDQKLYFNIKVYSNIQVNQNINVIPEMRLDGSSYGS